MVNPRKTYFIDNAVIRKTGFSFTDNLGRLLENLVFLELKRRGYEIFYFAGEKTECDFLLRKENKIVVVIQVSFQLNDENKTREFKGIFEAMEFSGLKEGVIITNSQKETRQEGDKIVKVIPAWEWLLK